MEQGLKRKHYREILGHDYEWYVGVISAFETHDGGWDNFAMSKKLQKKERDLLETLGYVFRLHGWYGPKVKGGRLTMRSSLPRGCSLIPPEWLSLFGTGDGSMVSGIIRDQQIRCLGTNIHVSEYIADDEIPLPEE